MSAYPVPRNSRTQSLHPYRVRLSIILILIGVFLSQLSIPPAFALDWQAGFQSNNGALGLYYNSYTGDYVSCVDPMGPPASGKAPGPMTLEHAPISVTSGAMTMTYSANATAQLNWLLSNYGSTTDNVTAAAVEMVGWALASTGNGRRGIVEAVRLKGGGLRTLDGAVNYLLGRVPQANRQAVKDMFYYLLETAENSITAAPSTPLSTPTVTWANHSSTQVDMVLTLGSGTAYADVTLSNGIFTDTGTANRTLTSSGTFAVTIVPPAGSDAPTFLVSVSGVAHSGASANAWPAQLHIQRGSGQTMAAKGSPPEPNTIAFGSNNPNGIPFPFSPTLSSQVSELYYQPGDIPADTIAFSLAPGSHSWQKDSNGNDLPIIAQGTLYGPFLQQQPQSNTPPIDAPLAGTATATSGNPYFSPVTVLADTAIDAPGFYYWVWAIAYADQPPETQFFLPGHPNFPQSNSYAFSDDFAVTSETSIIPPRLSTTATTHAGVGEAFSDTVHVVAPLIAGSTVSFELFRLTKTPGAVVPVPAICAAESLIESIPAIPVIELGDLVSPKITVWEAGVYSWVATLRDSAGVQLWQGECGEESELTRVSSPEVTTIAHADSPIVPTKLGDTILITGTAPKMEYLIETSLYVFPWKYDSEGTIIQTENPLCTAETLIGTTEPLLVTEDGEYQLPPLLIEEPGIYGFVETTTITDSNGKQTVVSAGECGDLSETVTVWRAELFTVISESAVTVGEDIHDIAFICGTLHDTDRIGFTIYRRSGETPDETADIPVFSSVPRPAVTGVYTIENGCFQAASAPYRVTEPGNFYTVANITDKTGEVLAIDARGVPSESFTATVVTLAATGITGIEKTVAVIGATIVIGGAAPIVYRTVTNRLIRNTNRTPLRSL